MKISEMTNDQATEAILRIAPPISNICEDESKAHSKYDIDYRHGIRIVKDTLLYDLLKEDHYAAGSKRAPKDICTDREIGTGKANDILNG